MGTGRVPLLLRINGGALAMDESRPYFPRIIKWVILTPLIIGAAVIALGGIILIVGSQI